MTPPMAAKADVTDDSEIWLRGNVRPAIGLGVAVVAVGSLVMAAVAALGPPAGVAWAVAAICLAGVLVAGAVAWAARRPRLVHRGGVLEVRLSPLAVQRVPLEIVECVFPGSHLLGAGEPSAADRRVTTLVLRLAERAVEWRSRPTVPAWGTWHDGSVVVDGRWCEPLSPELARGISARLLEAKRRLAEEVGR